jgi:LmbE family N-acetylglucosaminyl deacetylase
MIIAAASAASGFPLKAQQAGDARGASALGELTAGLGVSARVLVIGAHPDDEDTRLITWLTRGRHVQTAYLSLTRGSGGQNLIGPELGEELGVIRTEELLAARRVDGARQYFTRAYDFGFSKSADEAFLHWPRDTLLGDVIRVVRAFRPHVIVSVFTGTPLDGHGHHQVAGILAREAYDLAGDTARFPASEFGEPWNVPKFYRSAWRRKTPTIRYNAGEYSPLLGRSYGEIAAESRSQHKSQAFGMVQSKGAAVGGVFREATRVNENTPAERERGLFDGVDTSLARVASELECVPARAAFDTARRAISDARSRYDAFDPSAMVAPLARATAALQSISCGESGGDARVSLKEIERRAIAALRIASGVAIEPLALREVVAIGDTALIERTVYNQGEGPVSVLGAREKFVTIAPDSARTDTVRFAIEPAARADWQDMMEPYWLAEPRKGDLYGVPISTDPAGTPAPLGVDHLTIQIAGRNVEFTTPVIYRYGDPVRGEVRHPLAVAPAMSVTLDRALQLAPANREISRTLRVTLRSASTDSLNAAITVDLPEGLRADSLTRMAVLPRYDATASVEFKLSGTLEPGKHQIGVTAAAGGESFRDGYTLIDYPHINPRRIYRDAQSVIEAVDVELPKGARIAYVPGASDEVAPVLRELGLTVQVIPPGDLSATDLSRFSTIVVGPRAYEISDELLRANERLLDFARAGGTVVMQYGQYEMTRPGVMPYPITLARPHDRVTDESGPVRILRPESPLLTTPNRITEQDFEGWVQDRSLYMPRTFDPHYEALLEVQEPGEPARQSALLVAPLGKGLYIYTTLAFFRQLPAGVPGAARLFVNLIGAQGQHPAAELP